MAQQQAELEQQRQAFGQHVAAQEASGQAAASLALQRSQLEQARADLEQQRAQLRIEAEDVQQQTSWLASARASLRAQRADEQHALSQLREQLLEQRRTNEQLNARLREKIQRVQDTAVEADSLAMLRRQLESEVTQLRDEQATLEQQRLAAVQEQELWRARTAQQRQALARHWQQRRVDLQRQRQRLQQRQRQLQDQEQSLQHELAALQQAYEELAQRRLVIQHAEATLRYGCPPDDFAHLEHAVQELVAERMARAQQTLATHKRELQVLAASLYEQQELLKRRHTRLQTQLAWQHHQLDAPLQHPHGTR